MSLLFVVTLVSLGALVSGQERECPTNPCANGGECVLKPDDVTPYCQCPVNYEGELCNKFNRPLTGCVLTERNFYGQKTGSLSSPNYPADYPISQFCAYFIGTADAKKFELTFHDLALEKGKDELSIGSGAFTDLQRYEYLYDQEEYNPLPGPVTIEGDRVWFNFYSDFNENNKGFRVSWRIDGDECLDNTCSPDQTCVDGEYTYTCKGGLGNDQWSCSIGETSYPHGLEWDPDVCSYCNCRNGTATCKFRVCTPIRCRVPIKEASVCCHKCPPARFIVNEVSFKWSASSGSVISHKSNARVLNVNIGHDVERSSLEVSGSGLWKVGMYTKMKAEAGGGRISVSEQILDNRKANKILAVGTNLKFNRLKYNLDLTDRRCEDIEEVCVEFDKGDNANPDYYLVPEPNPDILTSCQSVECPPPPPGVTCSDEASGKEYQDGQEWTTDPCTACTCHSGHADCITLQCPLLDCAETRPVEDQCCPQCLVEATGTCVYEGVTRESGSTWALSDCVNCHCDDGSISCEFFGCQCPITPEELNNCGGYKNGATWFESNCVKCTCTEGEITCVGIPCTVPDCVETVQGETDCCPRCKGDPSVAPLPCKQGDQSYYHGQQWKFTDCITCACSNGYTSCAITECKPLTCENPEVVEGECCLVCPDEPEDLFGKPCIQNNRVYVHGDSWQVDPCTNCFCDSTVVICAVLACGIPNCPGRIIYDDLTVCCPYCDETDTGPGFCTYMDLQYVEGQTWNPNPCLSCSCTNGAVECFPILCAVFCDTYEQVPGECCPRCVVGPEPLVGCTYEGQDYVQGETFNTDPCTSCHCNAGLVTCAVAACQLVVCNVDLVTLPDECCQVCPELYCTDLVTGQRIENGQKYKPNPCSGCGCTDGIMSCVSQLCQGLAADCVTSYTPDGECCPICIDGPERNLNCMFKGAAYVDGEQWRPDACQFCNCNNATVFCVLPTCNLLCDNPLPPVAGQCCGSCPEDPRCMYDGIDYGHGDTWRQGDCENCICIRGETACTGPACSVPSCENPTVQPGACCLSCPPTDLVGLPCTFKGNTYQSGDQFQKDACTTCHCAEGFVQCVPVACEPVSCHNAILQPGKCCLECPAEPCITKSGIHSHGEQWQEDDCTTCRCSLGATTCDAQTCPELSCTPEDVAGACCDQCPGDIPCEFKGKTYVKGQRFQPNPCEFCSCQDGGGIFCVPASCPTLECNNPVRREGQCCAVCEGDGVCMYEGKEYPNGKSFDPTPCSSCRCSNNLVSCVDMICDIQNCPDPIVLEGACCPSCEGTFCTYGGKVYPDGAKFKTDECSVCTCEDGGIGCVGIPCSPLDCPAASVILKPDQCCPTCPEPAPSCTYLDRSYAEGARWRINDCRDCWCQDSKIYCADITCFATQDCNTVQRVEAKCCPVCTDPPPPPSQDCTPAPGLTYQEGSRWYTNCGYCTCLRGAISCVNEFCQTLTCDNQVMADGSCCSVCIEDSQTCSLFGNTYQHRAVFRINECVDCMCYDSAFYCWGSVCRKSTCDNPIKIPGKCCLECPEDPAVVPLQDCVLADQRTYAHGTFFQTDPCIYCYCNNGSVICIHEPCEAKACDVQGEVTLEGECCSRCRSEIKTCVVKGETYSHDDRWRIGDCKECYCDNGVTKCSNLMCPEVTCSDPVKEEGSCCQSCPTDPVGTPCTFKGMEYTEGLEWRINKCTLCTCTEGTVKCTADQCPPLACDNPVTIKGECCRLCPDDAKPCEIDGKIYKHGESFRNEACLECSCNNGAKTCNYEDCPAIDCRSTSSFMVEGECCPQCPGDKKHSCEVDGLKYSDGQRWARGDCETCQCDQGQLSCTFQPCPSVSCENAVVPDGECCQKCPEDLQTCPFEGGDLPHGKYGLVPGDSCNRCSCSNGELSCLVENCPVPNCDNPMATYFGCCQSCPDEKICTYNGYEFVHGQSWQKNTCTFCQCISGDVVCDQEVCPTLTCTDIVQVDGECCPRCKDNANLCTYGSTDYEHGAAWSADECTRCSCDDGAVGCDYQNCPAVTCPNPTKAEGQCCQLCPGDPQPCDTARGVYSDGETWRKNKCQTCTCVNGIEQCETELCPVLTCTDSRKVKGECCRKCAAETRSCSVGGVLYEHKQQWQPNLCRSCQCDDGTVDCMDQTCPVLECPEPLQMDDRCCPLCPGEPPHAMCRDNNQMYSDQQEWRTDDCTTCSCNDGIVTCTTESCPALQCELDDPIALEGKCCMICPEEAQSCEINGATYKHGKSWRDGDCRVCSCDNSQTTCDFEVCTVQDCDDPIKVEGKCCLQCPDVIPARDCEYKSNFYPHSYRWNSDICTQCNCNDGTVGCKAVNCPEIYCTSNEEVILDGECCPVCPDQTLPCVDKTGTTYLHGERWPISDCTRCTCLNSDISCDTSLCPKPECDNVISVDGQCCDGCRGEPAKILKAACIFRGREYADGEWWVVDDCKSCTCDDGVTSCGFESCTRLTCEGTPIQEDGKCCTTCPADAEFCTVDGTMYDHGATWTSSVCTDCTCNDDSVTCNQEVCPALTCTETEDVGQCCKQCKGDPAFKKCTYKDKEYKHGYVLRKNNCKTCTCEDGSWACENELCPELTCSDQVSVKGQCCKKCPEDTKSCEVDGTTYRHGDKWSDTPCSDCQCDNGGVVCDHQSCPVPDCSDAAIIEGECCPTCPGILPYQACRSGNQKYRHGEWWSPTDCAQCTCMDGDIYCQTDTCPRLTCDNPVKVQGECCKKCPDEMNVCQLDGNGDVREHLQTWRVDNCKTCTCYNGKVSCDTQTCPAVDCTDTEIPENQCCPVCPDSTSITAKSCEVRGQTYQHGERWDKGACKSCVCDNGKVNCDSPACDALTCSDPIKVAGECCLRCPEDAQPCTTPDNVEYPHGGKWRESDCLRCQCNNGRTECDETRCPALDCSNPITIPGQCCKQCEGRPFETCTYKGRTYRHGDRWDGKTGCTTCSCSDGSVDCETQTCPSVTCSDPVKVKGQCCRVCVDDYATCVASDGTKRKHGEEWKDSDCITCTCVDGTTSCNTLKCPALTCTSGIRDPQQCCPRCPTDPAPLTCRVKNGVEYISGQSWPKGPCRTCSCDAGNKNCETDTCPVLTCSDPEKVGDECCKRCPEDIPTCLATGGTSYKHGETWQPDACTTCKCSEGTIICSDKLCPKATCDNPVDVEGECCPQCPGVPAAKSCKQGDQTRAHGETWQVTPCKSCSCSNGRIDCESDICPTLTCTDTVRSGCCRICIEDAKDCPSESGTPYKHGETWSPDPCITCKCYNEETVCTTKSCNTPACDNYTTSTNECCPRCPGEPIPAPCQYQGYEVTHGDWWRINTCKFCQCNNGIVGCATETCPLLTCPNSIKVPGECCRICIDEPDSGCIIAGRQMQTGETFRQSPCTTCTCFFGSLECELTVCTTTNCDNPVKAHGECCARCPDEPELVPCSFRGKTYRSGESWTKGPCKTCNCENGKINCENQQCPAVTCDNPTRFADECCMKCPDELKVCTSGDGTVYDHATSFKRSDCVTCSCDNAVITCEIEVCPEPDCMDPEPQEGKCCDTCPGAPLLKACTTKTGQKMRHGRSWRKNPCKVCTCDNGNIRCDKKTCPTLPCDQPLKRKADECCRQCPPDPDNACTADDGTTYMPGEKWNPDLCTKCKCTKLGGVKCTTTDCPALDCAEPSVVEGQCCMTCERDPIIKPVAYCTPTRKEGDTWHPTPCARCTCTNGEISCEVETCDTLECTDVIKIPGDCCARCASDIRKCTDADGTAHKQGDYWRPTNCEECTCDGGMTLCRPITCEVEPTCSDPQSIAGICCPVCPDDNFDGCDVNKNRRINHGESLKLDDCNTCTCSDGRFNCQEEVCPAKDCDKTVKREGECCLECPLIPEEGDCTFEGTTYRSGDTFEDPADSCLLCMCSMAEIVCGQPGTVCPAVQCTAPVILEGECCPTCAEGVCEYENKLYQSGDKWQPSDCEDCICSMGTVACSIQDCALEPCSGDRITIPGRCCPECPDDYRTCMDKVGMYTHGAKWIKADDVCVECFCDDSAICCEHIQCPKPECQDAIVPPGQCCPVCDLVIAECNHKSVIYQHGETFEDECSNCECAYGEVTCTRIGCGPLPCPNPRQDVGDCCPKCGAPCFHQNAEYQDGEVWSDQLQPCISCSCTNRVVICGVDPCPQLTCSDATLKTGDCCPKCPDITFGRSRLELYGSVNNYGLNFIVNVQNTEKLIEGPDLWRVRLWSATRANGGGPKLGVIKQALNKEQASMTPSGDGLRFEALEYIRDLGGLPCESFSYVCAEFFMTRTGYDKYTTSTTFGEEISSICLNAC